MKKFWPIILVVLFAGQAAADRWRYPSEILKQEYSFGDVRIELVRDATENYVTPYFELNIYKGGELQATHKNISFEHIYASDDHQFFAGLSNSGIPGTAFVVFDSSGELLKSVHHRNSSVDYIGFSATLIRSWFRPDETSVRFVNPSPTELTKVIVERKGMPEVELLSHETGPASHIPRNLWSR